jgi:chemosensory pili system protein ChpE/L-lysine exporter family protein LysE/ArgO
LACEGEPTVFDYVAFFAGFMLSSIVWAFLFAALVDRLLGGVGVRWAQITYRACAVAFVALALSSLRELWVSVHLPQAQTPSDISRKP